MLKTASSVINALGALVYQGTWDASANSPTLTSSVGVKGNYYVVSVAGTTTLNGISLWSIGDWAVFNGSVWQKVDGGSSEAYVNLTVSGTANIATSNIANVVSSNVQISGGSVNNVTIGGTTRNTGAFTTELVGPSGSANFTRFPNAVAVISNVVTNQQNEIHNIGIMGEGVASATDTTVYGVGVYGAGYTNSATRSGGVVGEGHVTASADTGLAIGVRGYAYDIHAGGFNIGLYGDSANGSTNYALYLNNGDIYSATAKTWVQNGNLTISGATTNIANLVSANVTFSGGNAAINITAGNVSANVAGSTNLNVANAVSILTTTHGGTGLTSVPHTVQIFTSGSGTYTLPANCKAIKVTMVGGGGGGGPSGTSGGGTAGTGGTTTFGTALLTCTGGVGASGGGSATGGDFNLPGMAGAYGPIGSSNPGGMGGGSPFGGQGFGVWSNNAGSAAVANTGSGGGSGAANTGNFFSSIGGGSGGYLQRIIGSPSATYAYAVGAGGAGGTAGIGGTAGGAGGSGVIIVEEYYV